MEKFIIKLIEEKFIIKLIEEKLEQKFPIKQIVLWIWLLLKIKENGGQFSIDNLITGGGKNLASPSHKNFRLPYVQDYIKTIGIRKCEANAIMPKPNEARKLVEDTIIGYLGNDSLDRFNAKLQKIKDEINDFRVESGLEESIQRSIDLMDEHEG